MGAQLYDGQGEWAQTEPLPFKPLMVEAREPGAGEIARDFAGTFRA